MFYETGNMKRVIKTRPVGDVFTHEGRMYEVVACDRGCRACDMYEGTPDDPCVSEIEVCGLCTGQMRSDGVDVVFRQRKGVEA